MKKILSYSWIMWIPVFVLVLFVSALGQSLLQAKDLSPANPVETTLIEQLNQVTQGMARISYHAETGKVTFIGTTPEQTISQPLALDMNVPPEEAARAFLAQYGVLFGLTEPDKALELMRENRLEDGRSFVRFQQVYQSIPVLGGELIVQMKADQSVISANGEILPDLSLGTTPSINAETARQNALAKVAKDHQLNAATLTATEPELWIYNPVLLDAPGLRKSSLVWRIEISSTDLAPIRELTLVDAHLGAVALQFNQIDTAKNIKTYSADNTTILTNTLICDQSNPSCIGGDAHAASAHIYAGDTYDFYWNEHGRDSIDNAGMTITSTVHYGSNYGNAFWNGEQMVYGDQYGFPLADDVVAHELTHGVTQHESHLFYYYQSGAINESLSDVWGEFVDQGNGRGTDTAGVKWQIGEDVSGLGALRDMADPTQFNDPDKMTSTNYYCGEDDNGGVHTNSGVNNKAAYLMVDGGTFNGYTIPSLGIAKTADLYYEAQTNLLTSGSNFNDLYNALIQASKNLNFSTAEKEAVENAVKAVKMNQRPCDEDPEAPVCDPGHKVDATIFSDDMENTSSGNWSSVAIAGSDAWYYPQNPNPYFDATNASSGIYNIWGYNRPDTADSYIAMTNDKSISANSFMRFKHFWAFEDYLTTTYDGGVLEYSTNGGATWSDTAALFIDNGYNGTISTLDTNPLGGRQAFIGESDGYTASRLNLGSLDGQNVRFRFRIGTDSAVSDLGWFIDDVQIYTCIEANTQPTIANLPDQTVTGNTSSNNAIDLWAFADDFEDEDSALIFSITNTPVVSAGITLDSNRYIDISPILGWTGSTNVTVQVKDTGDEVDSDTFTVFVIPPYYVYLPIVSKCYPMTPALAPIDNSDHDGVYSLSWTWPSCAPAASSYELQVDTDANFTNPTSYTPSGSSYDAYTIAANTYYWRARAFIPGAGWSDWSNVESTLVNSMSHIWIENNTGGDLTVEFVGVAKKSFSTGTFYWLSLTPGTYTYNATAHCGSNSWTEAFTAREIQLTFVCSSDSPMGAASLMEAHTIDAPKSDRHD